MRRRAYSEHFKKSAYPAVVYPLSASQRRPPSHARRQQTWPCTRSRQHPGLGVDYERSFFACAYLPEKLCALLGNLSSRSSPRRVVTPPGNGDLAVRRETRNAASSSGTSDEAYILERGISSSCCWSRHSRRAASSLQPLLIARTSSTCCSSSKLERNLNFEFQCCREEWLAPGPVSVDLVHPIGGLACCVSPPKKRSGSAFAASALRAAPAIHYFSRYSVDLQRL